MHDRVIVLREHHFPIFESLRRSLWHRRNARLEFKSVSQVVVVSVGAYSLPQQVPQTVKRAHDGEPLRVHGGPSLLRATKDAAQKPKWLMAHFYHLDATLKLSLWDPRQETPPMVVRSIGRHQYLIPVLRVRPSDGAGHQVLCITSRSHLLALPSRRSPDKTRFTCSGVKFPPRAHPERPKGARQPLSAEQETSATSFTACKSCISSPAVCGRRMPANPLKHSRS